MSEEYELRIHSVPCFDFMDENGEQHKVTAIVAPIRITRKSNVTEIAYACNRGPSCRNPTCRYSRAAQLEEPIKSIY